MDSLSGRDLAAIPAPDRLKFRSTAHLAPTHAVCVHERRAGGPGAKINIRALVGQQSFRLRLRRDRRDFQREPFTDDVRQPARGQQAEPCRALGSWKPRLGQRATSGAAAERRAELIASACRAPERERGSSCGRFSNMSDNRPPNRSCAPARRPGRSRPAPRCRPAAGTSRRSDGRMYAHPVSRP